MFNQQDLNAPFLMHKELGFGPRFVDRENRVAYPTLANLAIRRRAQFELLAEEMRVLYVALTRPKEKMILLGTVKDAAKKALAWSQVKDSPELALPDYLLAAGRNYLDWIGPSLMRHPDAAVLRELAGSNDSFSACLADDQSRWAISIISADHVSRDHVVNQTLGEEDGMTEVRKERTAALKAVQPVKLVTSSTVEELTKSAQVTANQNIGDEGAATVDPQQEEARLINEVDQRLSWTYPLKQQLK